MDTQFILRVRMYPPEGMLYYTVQSGEHVATRRMIMQGDHLIDKMDSIPARAKRVGDVSTDNRMYPELP